MRSYVITPSYQFAIVRSRDGDVVMLSIGVIVSVVVDDLDPEPVIKFENETTVVLHRQLEELVVLVERAFHVWLNFEQQPYGENDTDGGYLELIALIEKDAFCTVQGHEYHTSEKAVSPFKTVRTELHKAFSRKWQP